MMHFCTLFDSRYLSRGLTMYESLKAATDDFHLYIFPFDHTSLNVLRALKLSNATIVSLEEFEDERLLEVKPTRSSVEYLWTASSSTILYVLEKFRVPHCTYVDADLFFYDSPKVLFEEMGESSILITEHRYAPRNDISHLSGIYCVQFSSFKNDEHGLKTLRWWRNACLDWCYAREEDGKFGDQKYLDDWPARFSGVHALGHLGGGVAPWNAELYEFTRSNGRIHGKEKTTGRSFDVVFFHFHYLRHYDNGTIDLGDYRLSPNVRTTFYESYLKALEEAKRRIHAIDNSFDPHGPRSSAMKYDDFVIMLKRRIKRQYNVYARASLGI